MFGDFEDFWSPFLGGQGSAPTYVAALDDAARARLRDAVQARLPREDDGSVRLTSRGRSWTAIVDRAGATVADGTEGEVAAEIYAEPANLLLWLWGRLPDEAVQTTGDEDLVRRFHRRLAEVLT